MSQEQTTAPCATLPLEADPKSKAKTKQSIDWKTRMHLVGFIYRDQI